MDASEIAARVGKLDGWRLDGGELVKEFEFAGFAQAIEFVNGVAAAAEAMDHHPDMDVRYRWVKLTLTTRSAAGLTALDFELARRADAAAKRVAITPERKCRSPFRSERGSGIRRPQPVGGW